MRYHPSWSSISQECFEKIIRAHGGWELWDDLDQIDLKLNAFKGFLLLAKGHGRSFRTPKKISIRPKQQRTTFFYDGHQNIYSGGRISHSPYKLIVENGRDLFKRTMFEQWKPEHFTYFFGYALVNYVSYPFILAEHELLGYEIDKESSRFKIRFSEDMQNHCREQTFYFNSDYLFYRHDYHAEVAGPYVFAAHHSELYQDHKGLKLASRRRVCPRLGPLVLPAWAGIYSDIEIQEVQFKL